MKNRIDLYELGGSLVGVDVRSGGVVPAWQEIGGFWFDEAVPGDKEYQRSLAESVYKPRGYGYGTYYPIVRMKKVNSIGEQFDALEKLTKRKFDLLRGRLRYHAKKMK